MNTKQFLISVLLLSTIATYSQHTIIFYKKNNLSKSYSLSLGMYNVILKEKNKKVVHTLILSVKDSTLSIKTELKGATARRAMNAKIGQFLADSVISTDDQIDSVYKRLNISEIQQLKLDRVNKISIPSTYRSEMKWYNESIGKLIGVTGVALPVSVALTKGQAPVLYAAILGTLAIEGIIVLIAGRKRIDLKKKWAIQLK